MGAAPVYAPEAPKGFRGLPYTHEAAEAAIPVLRSMIRNYQNGLRLGWWDANPLGLSPSTKEIAERDLPVHQAKLAELTAWLRARPMQVIPRRARGVMDDPRLLLAA